jgi:hypothetical protein
MLALKETNFDAKELKKRRCKEGITDRVVAGTRAAHSCTSPWYRACQESERGVEIYRAAGHWQYAVRRMKNGRKTPDSRVAASVA